MSRAIENRLTSAFCVIGMDGAAAEGCDGTLIFKHMLAIQVTQKRARTFDEATLVQSISMNVHLNVELITHVEAICERSGSRVRVPFRKEI